MSEWFEAYGYATVHPNLMVGAVPLDANDVQILKDNDVDRVLNLVEDGEYPDDARLEVEIALTANDIEEHRVSVVDYRSLSAPAIDEAVTQVDRWLSEGHTVYLHCRAGWQRSATVAGGVIAIREETEIPEALDRLNQRKPTAKPLPHQEDDLKLWWALR